MLCDLLHTLTHTVGTICVLQLMADSFTNADLFVLLSMSNMGGCFFSPPKNGFCSWIKFVVYFLFPYLFALLTWNMLTQGIMWFSVMCMNRCMECIEAIIVIEQLHCPCLPMLQLCNWMEWWMVEVMTFSSVSVPNTAYMTNICVLTEWIFRSELMRCNEGRYQWWREHIYASLHGLLVLHLINNSFKGSSHPEK